MLSAPEMQYLNNETADSNPPSEITILFILLLLLFVVFFAETL